MTSDVPNAPLQDYVGPAAGDWMGEAPQDDDAMMAPAPDASAFIKSAASRAVKRKPTSDLKQTLVPILLTSGLMLCVMGSLKFFLGEESPYSALPTWVIGMMYGLGGVLLILAMFTMLQVKDQLTRDVKKS